MNRLTQRYAFFVLGVAINSFGVAFITKSALGTSQISSIPYVLSLRFPALSFGVFTFVFNMLLILIQVALLKREFRPIQFLQIAVNVLFSALIDLSMAILWFFQPESLPVRLISLVLGCLILALGISIEVVPDTLVVPGEGVVRAISRVSGKQFGSVKVCFDVTLILIAMALSLLFFGRLNGIGFGTVVSALTVGKFVNIIDRRIPLLPYIRSLKDQPVEAEVLEPCGEPGEQAAEV